ncbi:hypothetical protein LINPERPRIM_LOCUS21672, partial [Linum perenne]
RAFWIYFQYERIPSICFRCGFLGHNQGRCPSSHLKLNPESRGPWMIIPRAGRRLNPESLMPNRQRHMSRSGTPQLPPEVAARMSFARQMFNANRDRDTWSTNDHHNLPIPLVLALPAPPTFPGRDVPSISTPVNIIRSGS